MITELRIDRQKMKTKEQKIALLEETTNFFNSQNRCRDKIDGGCKYYMKGLNGCAIGRLIEDKELCKELDKMEGTEVSNIKIFELLPENLQEYGQSFLVELQKLHDTEYYWNDEGLSLAGEVFKKQMKDKILQEIL